MRATAISHVNCEGRGSDSWIIRSAMWARPRARNVEGRTSRNAKTTRETKIGGGPPQPSPQMHAIQATKFRTFLVLSQSLLLIDGLDEAGAKRAEIERHVVDVLAPHARALQRLGLGAANNNEGRSVRLHAARPAHRPRHQGSCLWLCTQARPSADAWRPSASAH